MLETLGDQFGGEHVACVPAVSTRPFLMHARDGHPEALELEARLLSYRATDYGIAPYLRLTGGSEDLAVVEAPAPLPIRAVAISPSPNGAAAEHSVQRLLHANGYGDVPVVRSTIPYRS